MKKQQEAVKILIFGGTTEGRRAAGYLAAAGVRVHVCVATGYGEMLLEKDKKELEGKGLTVSARRMEAGEMAAWIREFAPGYVIDATHPYAREATENIRQACETCQVPCLRLLRETDGDGKEKGVASAREAAEFLSRTEGKILVTTGSKDLAEYQKIPGYEERVYVRVLPAPESLEACRRAGIGGDHILAMQGPFSQELNVALLRQYHIQWMVTKASGRTGGYPEKQAAALEAGAGLVVIEKPEEETGYSWEEICSLLTEELGLVPHWQVTVAGIGPGGEEGFTREAWEACRSAGLLIGAERMLKAAAVPGQKTYAAYDPGEILSCIHAHPEEEQVTVALSGDIGFYSGARKLEEALGEDPRIQVRLVPGVASAVVFAARMGIPWEDVAFASIHGRKCSPISLIRENQKTMILAGSREGVKELGSLLVEFGLGGIRAVVGTRLSYPEEKILRGDGNMLREYDGDGLALIYLENLQGGKEPAVPGRPDGTFLRGEVPMTKEEVRSVSLAKLRPGRDWVIYDIGAGTGSVAVEAALAAWQGQVYAIEQKREALDLIRENARRFGTDNVTVVPGEAPEALDGLPAPDGVFIGGSGGKLPEILEAVFAKNPKARVVLNAVTLETVAEAVACMKKWNLQEEEVVQLNVSRARRAGAYHLMEGQNPIYIISMTGGGGTWEESQGS